VPQLFAWFCLAAKRFINEILFMANQVMSNTLSGPDHWLAFRLLISVVASFAFRPCPFSSSH
jgi:hypothetical protein